jgi:HemK-related putative methylase
MARVSRAGLLRRAARRALHAAAYRFVLNPPRARTRRVRAAGLDLVVPPTVFHPRLFVSSELLAGVVDDLSLDGRRVADAGTGSGILALAAARAGATSVLAVDVNPAAARAARTNAARNGYADRVHALCGDLLSAVSPDARFDIVLSNPPFFADEPRDLADRAWHAGRGYRHIAPLFAQTRARLAPGGRAYVVLSSGGEVERLLAFADAAGFRHRVARERRLLFESLVVYELTPHENDSRG